MTATAGFSRRCMTLAHIARTSDWHERTVSKEPLLQASACEIAGKRSRCQRGAGSRPLIPIGLCCFAAGKISEHQQRQVCSRPVAWLHHTRSVYASAGRGRRRPSTGSGGTASAAARRPRPWGPRRAPSPSTSKLHEATSHDSVTNKLSQCALATGKASCFFDSLASFFEVCIMHYS
jgi:hypothetical protein